MSTWLTAWRNREQHEAPPPVMELLVVAGADAGSQFTLEGDEVLVGRGQREQGATDVVRLHDKSVSRRQAWIRRDRTGTSIEHIESASNPTLLNGESVTRAVLSVGDRIEMGRVLFDVRAREGMNLSGFTEIMEDVTRETATTNALEDEVTGSSVTLSFSPSAVTEPPQGHSSEVTDIRELPDRLGELEWLRGGENAEVERFPVRMGRTSIGRADGVDVQIPEGGVSRLHAEIGLAGRDLVLTPRSGTNPTLVNGFPIVEPIPIRHGDEIQLADRIVLRLVLDRERENEAGGNASSTHASTGAPLSPSRSDLSQRMENKIDLDREIERFNVMGSFLDVDVVGSRQMKGGGEKAEHIIVSFERFRDFVGGICQEWDGQVLNSNGDELMCFFEEARNAVLAGSAILARLADFNRNSNLLSRPFRFRLGAHTGLSLVDLDAGIAYSEVLDMAGHIQKFAEPDSLLVSQTTLNELPKGLPFTPAGELTGGGGQLYRLDGILESMDPKAGG